MKGSARSSAGDWTGQDKTRTYMIDEQTMLTNCMQCKTVNWEDSKHIDFLKSEIEEMSRAKNSITSHFPRAFRPRVSISRNLGKLGPRYPWLGYVVWVGFYWFFPFFSLTKKNKQQTTRKHLLSRVGNSAWVIEPKAKMCIELEGNWTEGKNVYSPYGSRT